MSDNRRRSRTQSLVRNNFSEVNENAFVEGVHDEQIRIDEASRKSSPKKPSVIAKEEIAEARRFSEKLSSPPSPSESLSKSINSSTPSLLGSIYSIGGAVWSFIRGNIRT